MFQTKIYLERKEPSDLSTGVFRVDPWLPDVYFSNCKDRLDFDQSPALQLERDKVSQRCKRQPALDKAEVSFFISYISILL